MSPLEFEITRVDCIYIYIYIYISDCSKVEQWCAPPQCPKFQPSCLKSKFFAPLCTLQVQYTLPVISIFQVILFTVNPIITCQYQTVCVVIDMRQSLQLLLLTVTNKHSKIPVVFNRMYSKVPSIFPHSLLCRHERR